MAISKISVSASLLLEVEAGVSKTGNKLYKKKSFNGVSINATNESVFAVASAISAILEKPAGGFYLAETAVLVSEQ